MVYVSNLAQNTFLTIVCLNNICKNISHNNIELKNINVMKTNAPNDLINQPNNVLLLRNPLILMMRKLLLLLVFVLYGASMSAQDSRNSNSGVMEINAFVASLKANDQTSKGATSFSAASSVEDLVYKVQSSVYYYGGTAKTYGAKPRCLFTDKQSLNGLNNSNMLKNNIEIVTIRINSASDLNGTIDLSLLSSFKNLKYVYIVSNVEAQPYQFTSMVNNPEERLSVFYKINKGEGNQ